MRQPLVGLCLAFCLGIVAATYIKIPFPIFYILTFIFLILSIISIRTKLQFNIFLLCLFFFLAATLLRASQNVADCHIARITPYKGRYVTLGGIVDSDPLVSPRKTTFVFRTEELLDGQFKQKACGKVLASVFSADKLDYGEELILTGSLYKPLQFSISDSFNYRDYLAHRGIYSLLSIKKDRPIIHSGINRGNPLKRFSFWLKHRVREVINKNMPSQEAALLNGMLLGERQNITPALREVFVNTGTAHILAISGLHVGIIAFTLLIFLKTVRIPRKLRYIIILISLILYCLLTGSSASTLRATVMAIVLLLGFLMQRQTDIYNSLSVAALIILGVNPNQLFDIGFQLSFISVFSIIWLFPKIKPFLTFKLESMQFLTGAFGVSLSAWIGTLGLIAYYFQIFSPVTILANLIVVPFMSVVLALGLMFGAVGTILPKFVEPFALSSQFSLLALVKINLWLSKLPLSYFYLPQIPLWLVLVYYLLVLLLANYSNLKRLISI